MLKHGASWLSINLRPYNVISLFYTFPKLEKIIFVGHGHGEHTNNIVGNQLFAANSGVAMLGQDDWL